jgi:ABC-type multidrug transport system fused ATPase/permease subunit
VWSENSTAGWTVVDRGLGFTGDLFYNNLCMLICSGLYFLLVCACEYGLFDAVGALCFFPNNDAALPAGEDEDVKRERERVDALVAAAASAGTDPAGGDHVDDDSADRLIVSNIQKEYAPTGVNCFAGGKKAVRGVSFAVPVKNCFGMLGHNGAGKTTTFSAMTGEHMPTCGDITVNGYSVKTDMGKVRHMLGYCPQFDAIVPLMVCTTTVGPELLLALRTVRSFLAL